MIYIKKKIYEELCTMWVPEECGFVVGKKDKLEKIYKIKNISKEENKFKMGFINKMKAVLDMMCHGYGFVIIYHVHEFNSFLSVEDIKNAISKMIYLIVYKNKLYFYKIKKESVDAVEYKVVGD